MSGIPIAPGISQYVIGGKSLYSGKLWPLST
jgi:hypothetical protein